MFQPFDIRKDKETKNSSRKYNFEENFLRKIFFKYVRKHRFNDISYSF